jgi:hypothetical protein
MHKRSSEGSIERAIEESWYPDTPDPVSIFVWVEVDATREFNRDSSFFIRDKTKWLIKIKAAEKIFKARIAEALLSDSLYVRTYAELIQKQTKSRKEKNAQLRAARRKSS